ncbi:Dehydrogenase reductase SDR family member 7B [Fusarium sp. NRRL 25303]|nr:Dehydrogenase reductase SDR family member 7B [Fusarium sp. NRRL 25303]
MDSFKPGLHNEVYPFIHPLKFKASLQDKVTLITGSTGTIGQALAECFSIAGTNLVLIYNRTEPSPDFLNRCRTLGATAVTPIQCNVSDLDSCQNLIKEYRTGSLTAKSDKPDFADNGRPIQMHKKDPTAILQDWAINLNGPMYLMRLVMPSFIQAGSGTIINIASRGGTVNIPFNTTYCASKAALIRLTSCWQAELELGGHDGIQMYSIHPGAVPSQMTSAAHLDEIMGQYPHVLKIMAQVLEGFKDSPYLSGMVSVALATGIAKDCLNGRYFDVQQDLEHVITQAQALKSNPDLYTLQVGFLGGLPNDGGTENIAPEKSFIFPGY